MNYFIGDLHLFNRNQTGEGVNYDGRPFATVDEMHRYIQSTLQRNYKRSKQP